MIVQMKKVSIVVLNYERKEALKKLKKAGVVHIEELEGSGEQLSSYKESFSNAYTASAILSEIKLPKKRPAVKSLSSEDAKSLCSDVISLSEEKKRLFEEIASDSSELERLSLWGSVNPSDFKYLDEKNIHLAMFEIPEDKYSSLSDEVVTVLVNKIKKTVRFLLVNGGKERPESLPPEAFEVPLPEFSTDFLKERISSNKKKISEIDSQLFELAFYIPEIEKFRKNLESDIQFETVYSGMNREENGKTTDLAWISGFVPVDSLDKLKSCVKENSWALSVSEPSEEDNVPTKLKNNKFVSL
ncbi:MAG: ATPase, partial [Spirochaetia bacterium]|nr:ATPase [Spirochaetia bacterium]